MEFLRTFAVKRGWSSANGLPDETRAGRTILKDYTAGKLVSAEMPPGFKPQNRMAMVGEQCLLKQTLINQAELLLRVKCMTVWVTQ